MHDTRSNDIAASLEELAGLINAHIASWHDFGYADPPAPECKAIPPLGERSAEAIKAGHQAVRDIDEMIRQLHALRAQLVRELRQDEDIRAVRVDAILAGHRADRATQSWRGKRVSDMTDAEVRAMAGAEHEARGGTR